MFFGDYNSHAVPCFVSSSFLPLNLLYFKSVAILMHDISKSLTPANISNLFASQFTLYSEYFQKKMVIAELPRAERAQRSTMGNKIW